MPGVALKNALTPRIKLATRLYATGACRTKRDACIEAGLHPYVLTVYRDDPQVKNLMASIDDELESGAIDMSKLRVLVGRKAYRNIAAIMEDDSVKMDLRLKAAQDLADRSPEVSKVMKLEVSEGLSLPGSKIDELLAAMLESAKARVDFSHVAEADYVTATDESAQRNLDQIPEVKQLPSGSADG